MEASATLGPQRQRVQAGRSEPAEHAGQARRAARRRARAVAGWRMRGMLQSGATGRAQRGRKNAPSTAAVGPSLPSRETARAQAQAWTR
jgi:hypothetical protein